MPVCIYCNEQKSLRDMSLEHIIPQSLGGAYAPDEFKTKNVCKSCNNNLGLFVDASFEKSLFISQYLQLIALANYTTESNFHVPLIPMGALHEITLEIDDGYICEYLMTFQGDIIFHIRPKDERLYWYTGGNPRTLKSKTSRAYFFLRGHPEQDYMNSLKSFVGCFPNRKTRKILANKVEGIDLLKGFSIPDEQDKTALSHFWKILEQGHKITNQVQLYAHYDARFLSKLSRGIGFCLFGERINDDEISIKLQRGIWNNFQEKQIGIRGGHLDQEDKYINFLHGHPLGISITVQVLQQTVVISINLGGLHTAVVECMETKSLTSAEIQKFKEGMTLILFKHQKASVYLPSDDFYAHRLGNILHPQLVEIESKVPDFDKFNIIPIP